MFTDLFVVYLIIGALLTYLKREEACRDDEHKLVKKKVVWFVLSWPIWLKKDLDRDEEEGR